MGSLLLSCAAVFLSILCFLGSTSADDRKKSVTFTKDVAPIFFKNCARTMQAKRISSSDR